MKENPAVIKLKELKRLLKIEYEEEKNGFTRITELAGIEKLKAKGDAWTKITVGRNYYNSLNHRVIEIFRRTSEEDDTHNFEHGRSVIFFILNSGFNSTFRVAFTGKVAFAEESRMVVEIPENADISIISSSEESGLMLSFDETSYSAMFEALDRTIEAKGRHAELCDLIYSKNHFSNFSLSPMRFPYLNRDQEDAVNKVLRAKDVCIVHGPPGTGKTTTLVEAIYETLRREPQVMVCAQSNMAVDWISEKLVDRGLNVVRIGNPSRVNDKMLSFTYERRFESHPSYPDLWGLRKTIRQLYKDRSKTDSWHQKIERLKARATELEIRINNDIFNSANVIACTLVGSSAKILAGMKFSSLFIDEAAQALEPATWIPIRRAGRVILAGDHCQLPPTVKSYKALKEGLGVSLMERIVSHHPESVKLLTVQYRMHESIMNFSNKWFYGGNMTAAPEVRCRGILDFDTPIEWIDTTDMISEYPGMEENVTFRESIYGNFGRLNRDEALIALSTLQRYIEKIGVARVLDEKLDIGIISPYREQARYIRSLLRKTPFFKKLRHLISVNTVDGFQGQERDIIIISMVRSNEEGQIGFLKDLRRMNVAMTRARMKLMIIANSQTLRKHKFYNSLYNYLKELQN